MAEINPDALLTASQGAAFCGVTVAAVVNWATRGYTGPDGEREYLRPATRKDGRPVRDGQGRLLYRLIAIARAEAATAGQAGRLGFRAA